MKYGEVIRDLASRGSNWRYYDENFRYMRQSNPSAFPWNTVHSELWIRSQPPANFGGSYQGYPRKHGQGHDSKVYDPKQKPITKGYCFVYHRGSFCPGCAYKHACPTCGSNHPLTKCNFRGPRNAQSSASSSSNANKAK